MGIFEKIFGSNDEVNIENKDDKQTNNDGSYDETFNSLINENDNSSSNGNDDRANEDENKKDDKQKTKDNTDNNKANDKQENQLGSIVVDIDGVPVTFEENELKDILSNSIKAKEKIDTLDVYANIAEEFKNSNIEPTDLVAFKDALTGNKEALKYILKKYNEDEITELLDDEDVNYEPEVDYSKNDFDIKKEFEKIVSTNEDLAFKIKKSIDIMPDSWKSQLTNKDIFNAFKEDVKNNVFDVIYPNAYKEYIKNPNLTLQEAYAIAYEKLLNNSKKEEKKEPTDTSYSKNSGSNKNTYDEIFEQLLKE